jgi:hypothetical protein
MILEPIAAGLAVALINKFVINNAWLWDQWNCRGELEDHEDCPSSTITATSDGVHHFNW